MASLTREPKLPYDRGLVRPQFSVWAIASVLLNVPWLLGLSWVANVYAHATGPIAGEAWLLPLWAWVFFGTWGGALGIVGLVVIRTSHGRLRGQWLALLGMAVSALVPAFGVYYVLVMDNRP